MTIIDHQSLHYCPLSLHIILSPSKVQRRYTRSSPSHQDIVCFEIQRRSVRSIGNTRSGTKTSRTPVLRLFEPLEKVGVNPDGNSFTSKAMMMIPGPATSSVDSELVRKQKHEENLSIWVYPRHPLSPTRVRLLEGPAPCFTRL
jgi:hypothetical protein